MKSRNIYSTCAIILYFFWLLTCLESKGTKNPPEIASDLMQNEVLIPSRHSITLKCPFLHPRKLMFEWFKDNAVIINGPKYQTLKNGSLNIQKTTHRDTGVYTCRAINGFGSVEVNITLIVVVKPKIIYTMDDTLPIVKPIESSFRLRCYSKGHPRPLISWYKDGTPIAHGSRMGQRSLKFKKAKPSDSGNYTCAATNLVGQDKFSFTLTVGQSSSPFKPIIAGSNRTVSEGETVALDCSVRVSSSPHLSHPIITWLKRVPKHFKGMPNENGLIFMEGDYFKVVSNPYPTDYPMRNGHLHHKLVIENVREGDADKYVCLAVSSTGYAYQISNLRIILRPSSYVIIYLMGAVLASAVIGISILLYFRPRKQQETDVEDPCKDEIQPLNERNEPDVVQSKPDVVQNKLDVIKGEVTRSTQTVTYSVGGVTYGGGQLRLLSQFDAQLLKARNIDY